MSSTQKTSSGEELPRLSIPWLEFVAPVVDRPRTPYYMQQQFLDATMTPWGADANNEPTMVADVIEPILVTDASREPRALLAPTKRDPDVDLMQAFIEAGVIAGVNLNDVHICNPWPEREPPTLLALYTRSLLDPSPFSNACSSTSSTGPGSTSSTGPGSTSSAGPSSEARLEAFKTAEQQIADAGRDPDCRLIHLCPMCEEELFRKSLLREHLRSHAGPVQSG